MLNPTIDLPQPYNKIGDGPEAPEVRLTVEMLRPLLVDEEITGWDIKSRKFDNLDKDIPIGTKITEISHKGKMIYFRFDNGKCVYNHLMLHGWWSEYPGDKYLFGIDAGTSTVYFMSSDKLSKFEIIQSGELDRRLGDLGPDMLSVALGEETFTKGDFTKLIKRYYRSKIGTWLIDQKRISGIGNYLRADILNMAEVSPFRIIFTLDNSEISAIYTSIITIVKDVYEQGGSIKYNNEREKGDFGYDFRVYMKDRDPSGNEVLKEKIGSRYIYWAPDSQE